MGMVLGVLPVVGIPLPFISYGGSAVVSLMAAIGLLMNVSVRRFILQR
jgi:rod shape determining protein RodA